MKVFSSTFLSNVDNLNASAVKLSINTLGNVCVQTSVKKPHSNGQEVNEANWNPNRRCNNHFHFSKKKISTLHWEDSPFP